jgi:hypothetical protein
VRADDLGINREQPVGALLSDGRQGRRQLGQRLGGRQRRARRRRLTPIGRSTVAVRRSPRRRFQITARPSRVRAADRASGSVQAVRGMAPGQRVWRARTGGKACTVWSGTTRRQERLEDHAHRAISLLRPSGGPRPGHADPWRSALELSIVGVIQGWTVWDAREARELQRTSVHLTLGQIVGPIERLPWHPSYGEHQMPNESHERE